jgi:hypothetical protein
LTPSQKATFQSELLKKRRGGGGGGKEEEEVVVAAAAVLNVFFGWHGTVHYPWECYS